MAGHLDDPLLQRLYHITNIPSAGDIAVTVREAVSLIMDKEHRIKLLEGKAEKTQRTLLRVTDKMERWLEDFSSGEPCGQDAVQRWIKENGK